MKRCRLELTHSSLQNVDRQLSVQKQKNNPVFLEVGEGKCGHIFGLFSDFFVLFCFFLLKKIQQQIIMKVLILSGPLDCCLQSGR